MGTVDLLTLIGDGDLPQRNGVTLAGKTPAEIVADSAAQAALDARYGPGGTHAPVAATTTTAGIVELATTAETLALTDTARAVTPAGLASMFRTGTGSPEGVVTAPVGTRYVDTAATLGAVEWVKASGTGNTGWRVVYGDTGWREIVKWSASGVYETGVLSASFAPRSGQAGSVAVRRIGYEVFWSIANIQAAAALNANSVYELTPVPFPAGFGGNGVSPIITPITTNVGYHHVIRELAVGGNIQLGVQTAYASGAVVVHAGRPESGRYTGAIAWPATLPGVAGA